MAKRWEYYPGKSLISCGGRCVSAKNLSIFYLTLALIVVSSGLFIAFDCRLLAVNLSASVPALAVLQFVFVLCCLLRTTFSDPGIIPRGSPDEAAWIEAELEGPKLDRDGNYRPPVRIKDVHINGRTFKLKYCFTCKIWRPPRASHCSTCDNCVDRFDHHCPWVGNCVGRRNYRYFYLFLASLSVYCFYVMVFGIVNLVMLANMRKDFLLAMKESPTSMLTILVAFFSIWSVVGLGGFHTLLICRETSTNEDIKGSFNHRRNPDLVNPFDHGNGLANCCYVLFGPAAPSLVKFAEADRTSGPGGQGFDSSLSLLTNGRGNGPVAVAAVPAVHYSNHHSNADYKSSDNNISANNGRHNPAAAASGNGVNVHYRVGIDDDDAPDVISGSSGSNRPKPATSVSYIV